MFRNIIDLIRKKEELKTIRRDFSPRYFSNDEHQHTYNNLGYVVIKNCIPDSIIEYANKTYYDLISKQSGFVLNDKFQNSGRLEDTNIRNIIIDEINKISVNILADIVIKENCEQKTGGAFQIKPASSTSILNPHQDSPIIDETKYYATYVWIPLCDTNVKNGTLHVLPKSHLWGNFQRSLNVPWPFRDHIKTLWKHMIPIDTNVGDIICFDSALIHSSTPNLSDKLRLAFTTCLLPKNYELVEYFCDQNTPKNKIEMYYIDDYYYRNCNIEKRPEENLYKGLELQKRIYPNRINTYSLKRLIQQH